MQPSTLKDAFTVEDILGKDVYDAAGEFVGVTNNMYLEKKRMKLLGLAVDKGFVARGLIVGTSYLQRITDHAVFLNTRPAYRLRGMTVFDKNGADVGKVVAVELAEDSNDVKALHVRKFFGKKQTIPAEMIASKEDNIFLNVGKEDI